MHELYVACNIIKKKHPLSIAVFSALEILRPVAGLSDRILKKYWGFLGLLKNMKIEVNISRLVLFS